MNDALLQRATILDTVLLKLAPAEKDAVVYVLNWFRSKQVELEKEVSRLKNLEADSRQIASRLKDNQDTVSLLRRRVQAKDKKHKNSVSAAQRLRTRRNDLKVEKQALLNEIAKLQNEIKGLREMLRVALPG